MLKIAIPKNMRSTIEEHFRLAGRTLVMSQDAEFGLLLR